MTAIHKRNHKDVKNDRSPLCLYTGAFLWLQKCHFFRIVKEKRKTNGFFSVKSFFVTIRKELCLQEWALDIVVQFLFRTLLSNFIVVILNRIYLKHVDSTNKQKIRKNSKKIVQRENKTDIQKSTSKWDNNYVHRHR